MKIKTITVTAAIFGTVATSGIVAPENKFNLPSGLDVIARSNVRGQRNLKGSKVVRPISLIDTTLLDLHPSVIEGLFKDKVVDNRGEVIRRNLKASSSDNTEKTPEDALSSNSTPSASEGSFVDNVVDNWGEVIRRNLKASDGSFVDEVVDNLGEVIRRNLKASDDSFVDKVVDKWGEVIRRNLKASDGSFVDKVVDKWGEVTRRNLRASSSDNTEKNPADALSSISNSKALVRSLGESILDSWGAIISRPFDHPPINPTVIA